MPRRRRSDSGFALLLVFLMAAIIAITLYMEIPRVAFQSARNKEQLLMERGEQYKIAVRRFLQANKRWPANMDELETLNNRRFLRRRYIDPMTGKDEWRLLHINNGVLTDSKNNKKKDQKEASTPNGFVQEFAGMGTTPANNGLAGNPALRKRPSDGGTTTSDPNNPSNSTGSPGTMPFNPTIPGVPGSAVNSQTGGTSTSTTGGGFVGGGSTIGTQSTDPTTGQPVYAGQSPYPTTAGSNGTTPGFPNPAATTGQANNAVSMINNILTSPRPGGLAGVQTQNTVLGGGGGIAGVASTVDEDSIMEYADHKNYSEWEFYYDGKFVAPPDPRAGNGGTSVAQMANTSGFSQPGSPVSGVSLSSTQTSGQGTQQGGGSTGTQQTAGGNVGGGSGGNTNLRLRPGRQ